MSKKLYVISSKQAADWFFAYVACPDVAIAGPGEGTGSAGVA
jgi:hypothetical protein